ncbi:MAG: glycosyltransferase family 1 protein [Hymenobacteraceae bacterium]|nr:glycosyltransferase family 1 protein [Hymenobacteraceae bacterium]
MVAAFKADGPDIVCFSHLIWEFVWQRPQHLLARFARRNRVYYVEDPCWHHDPDDRQVEPHLEIKVKENNLKVVVAHLPRQLTNRAADAVQERLLHAYLAAEGVDTDFIAWYYTPMALGKSRSFRPAITVYDCMDELAAFAFAPPELKAREQELLGRADLVFTGGQSIYEAKAGRHPAVFAFPSAIEKEHFGQARAGLPDPADQAAIPHPRIGFFGVIDERFDVDLVRALAARRPAWHFVLLGPVVKIDPATLPQAPNIHYPGGKTYAELPAYVGHWDVAALFFARNESTRYISPTKTPEYLAAGRPVVSTSICDVVRPYGEGHLVQIADTPAEWEAAVPRALAQADDPAWRARVDALLATMSWEQTWEQMVALVQQARMQQARM